MKLTQLIAVLLLAGASMVAMKQQDISSRFLETIIEGHGHWSRDQLQRMINEGAKVDFIEKNDDLTALMYATVFKGDYPELAEFLIKNGADVNQNRKNFSKNSPLLLAAMQGKPNITKLLIESGADLNAINVHGESALENAVFASSLGKDKTGFDKTVWVILTTIPLDAREKILKERESIRAGQLSLLRGKHASKDVRKLITQQIIDEHVDMHMQRIKKLILKKNYHGTSLHQMAKQRERDQAVVELLDLDNEAAQEKIRKMVRNNVKRILFGEPTELKPFRMSELENQNEAECEIEN